MRWVVNATPRLLYPRERLGAHCVGGCVGPQGRSGRLWKISPPTGIQSPDRPARSESLYRLSYRGPPFCSSFKVNCTRTLMFDGGPNGNGKESVLFLCLSPNVSDWFAVRAVSFPPHRFILDCSRVAYCCIPKIHVTRFSETSGNFFLSRCTASRSKRTFVSSVGIKTDLLIFFSFSYPIL